MRLASFVSPQGLLVVVPEPRETFKKKVMKKTEREGSFVMRRW